MVSLSSRTCLTPRLTLKSTLTLSLSLWLSFGLVLTSSMAPAQAQIKQTPPKAVPTAQPSKEGEKDKDKEKDSEKKKAEAKPEKPAPEPVIENVVNVQPEDLVRAPSEYLNKNVKFNAQFYTYSSVALDYKPAMRSSKDYFSFLVLRPNSHVPLSELKLAMPIPKDEKSPQSDLLQKLKDKDEVEVIGKVFSTALDEPWVDVLKIKLVKQAPENKKDEKAKTN